MKPRLTFEIAGPERRDAILLLRKVTYCDELGYEPVAAEWGVLDERASHLLALTDDGTAVGGMRLLGPAARPFEMETSLNLEAFLRPAHPPAEVTRFCIAPGFRRLTRGLPLQMGLVRLLYAACREHGIEDVYICAKPNAQKLYEFLLFEALTPADISYGPLAGDPHLLMRLDVASLPKRYAELNHPLKGAFSLSNVRAENGAR